MHPRYTCVLAVALLVAGCGGGEDRTSGADAAAVEATAAGPVEEAGAGDAHAGHDGHGDVVAASAGVAAGAAAFADHAGHGAHAASATGSPASAHDTDHTGHGAHSARAGGAPGAAQSAGLPADHAAHGAHAGHAGHAGHQMPELPATAGPGYTVADVHFMQMMMGHHAQALVMAEMAPTHSSNEMLQRLAEKIDISQRDEIAMMAQWLRERGQAVPTEEQMLAMHMPGMLTPAQLRQLDRARGREFDELFLTLMIQHHEGAIVMVDELFASPGAGQDSDIFRFATDVAADQGDEIFVMYRLLEMLAEAGVE